MARYVGPVCRLCRREGQKLFLKGDKCFTPKCPIEKRRNPPGMHGGMRRRLSDYGLRLREKQKARRMYGIFERQFRKYFELATSRPGVTGSTLLQLLESRLDNVVYRLGFASSRAAARQIVCHGHFALNGRKCDIPSALIGEGDVVGVSTGSRNNEYFKIAAERLDSVAVPNWLSLDREKLEGKVLSLPTRQEIDADLNEQLIVEYYSRR
ncbi:MAG: 30S ribosomal protein S4 [Chloroflexi bacterium]|nr:30S ribosomal protein S4 [Chloroflexota bacterium]